MARQKNDGRGRIGGRAKGTPNKTTATVKDWIQGIIDGHRKQFEHDLMELEPSERVKVITNLLQYVTPKVQSVSTAEMVEIEYRHLEELLHMAPDDAIEAISQRVLILKEKRHG